MGIHKDFGGDLCALVTEGRENGVSPQAIAEACHEFADQENENMIEAMYCHWLSEEKLNEVK